MAEPPQRPGGRAGRDGGFGHARGTRCTCIDLIYRQEAGRRPEVIVGDTGSYSDMVFGLLRLLGFDYRPQLADLPDAKLWRLDLTADYGALAAAARGRIDLGRVRRHWGDICRLVASVHTGAVQRPRRHPDAGAGGQVHPARRSLGPLRADLQDHARAAPTSTTRPTGARSRACATSRKAATAWPAMSSTAAGASYARTYHEGMEDQLGALGLVLNCITLWNTVYLDVALATPAGLGYPGARRRRGPAVAVRAPASERPRPLLLPAPGAGGGPPGVAGPRRPRRR